MSVRGAEQLFFCSDFRQFSQVGNSRRHSSSFNYSRFHGICQLPDTPLIATPFLPGTNTLDMSIMAQTSHIQSVSFGDDNTGCGNINNVSNTLYLSDEDERILLWVSSLEPNHRHQGVRTDRFEGVGEGLLETREFREWRGSEDGVGREVLFCSGNPGVGKTYLR